MGKLTVLSRPTHRFRRPIAIVIGVAGLGFGAIAAFVGVLP